MDLNGPIIANATCWHCQHVDTSDSTPDSCKCSHDPSASIPSTAAPTAVLKVHTYAVERYRGQFKQTVAWAFKVRMEDGKSECGVLGESNHRDFRYIEFAEIIAVREALVEIQRVIETRRWPGLPLYGAVEIYCPTPYFVDWVEILESWFRRTPDAFSNAKRIPKFLPYLANPPNKMQYLLELYGTMVMIEAVFNVELTLRYDFYTETGLGLPNPSWAEDLGPVESLAEQALEDHLTRPLPDNRRPIPSRT